MPVDAAYLDSAGVWVGFIFSLLVFSTIAGDHMLARLAQHILAGAALGYLAALVVQHVLIPRLVTPLLSDSGASAMLWIAALLCALLIVAGLERIARQDTASPRVGIGRSLLTWLGRIPVALALGTAIGTGVVGALQGTFVPQFARAARLAFDTALPTPALLAGVLTLLITTASLLYLYVDPQRQFGQQPAAVRQAVSVWLWLGQRAIWLTAGWVFGRLLASRLSLLIAQMQFFADSLAATGLGKWLDGLARLLGQ